MKKTALAILFIALAATLTCSRAYSQDSAAVICKNEKVKVDQAKYQPSGIAFGTEGIKPGDKLPKVWGLLGPPDKLLARRHKKDPKQDYVKLAYYSYGISIDINNRDSRVQGILVEENNSQFKLVNCPFRIGQSTDMVKSSWGDPEKQVKSIMAYWRRGVYIGANKAGKITHIYLTYPGQFKEEKK